MQPSFMEIMRKVNSLGKKPLPGERQGALGAIAESDSIQAGGGRMVSRRPPTGKYPEEATVAHAKNTSRTQQPPTALSEGAFAECATTKEGKARSRMKWDNLVNEFIMKATTELQGWRQI